MIILRINFKMSKHEQLQEQKVITPLLGLAGTKKSAISGRTPSPFGIKEPEFSVR